MKQVIAIVRMDKMNATKQALIEAGFPAFTAHRVLGRGKGNVEFRIGGGTEAIARLMGDGPRLVPKRMMTLAVPDESVSKVIEAIIKTNRTGNSGDGKLFVLPLEDAVRIRTGEHGAGAVN